MGFSIAQGDRSINLAWFPIDNENATTSLFVGQLVHCSTGSFNGVAPLADANGAYDVTGDQQILGIVVGTNNYPMTELNNATYGQYITGMTIDAGTSAEQKAIQKMGVEGMHPKGDPMPMVLVALLDPCTYVEGPIYNSTSAYGTAPTLLTVTTGATTGDSMTTNACEVATVANMCTAYCRTGANAGLYRVVTSASTTTHTFKQAFPYAIAVGDTFVIVNLRQGESYGNINTNAGYIGMCLDSGVTAATNYLGLTVKELNLVEAGKERAIFKFSAAHFAGIKS